MMLGRYSGERHSATAYDNLIWRITQRGGLINLILPFGLVALAYLARELGIGVNPSARPASYTTLLYVAMALGLAELAAAFVIRRVLFTPVRFKSLEYNLPAIEAAILKSATTVFIVGASPILYGVALYLLGGEIREVAYFGLLNLVAYRMLRPNADLIRKVLGDRADS